MMGPDLEDPDLAGIIPRTVDGIFNAMRRPMKI